MVVWRDLFGFMSGESVTPVVEALEDCASTIRIPVFDAIMSSRLPRRREFDSLGSDSVNHVSNAAEDSNLLSPGQAMGSECTFVH